MNPAVVSFTFTHNIIREYNEAICERNNLFLSQSSERNFPLTGDKIDKWYDLSGNNHHADVLSGSPIWSSNSFNSKPGVVLNKDSMVLDNSRTAFDGWNELTVVATFYQPGDQNFATLFGK